MAVISSQGSNRQYSRDEENGRTVIRVKGTSQAENHAFITMARHFHALGLPTPQVYSVSPDEMEYTQEDLGDTLLFDYIRHGRETGVFSDDEKQMLAKTIRALAHIQVEGAQGMDWSVCYPVPCFDRRSILWDLNYFKYDFLKLTGTEIDEPALENEFEHLTEQLLTAPCDVFMYRDCQSRNVMIKDGQPYFIDFQGGRRGPIFYDLASFLWQAKANFPPYLREELLAEYLDELQKTKQSSIDIQQFRELLNHFVLFRLLQVLGAYGFRGLYEHKQHFVESIPLALHNLQNVLKDLDGGYPYLATLAERLDGTGTLHSVSTGTETGTEPLTVEIYSFSFKRGIPQDPSGNGGGYVFDCRSTHNPGKYEEYKHLTGKDQPVIEFLEKDGEILEFLSHIYPIVDHHVERFLQRGLSHLQVSFGCTGGQHRSVYSAEALAKHLQNKYLPVYGERLQVRICHREQETKKG